MNKSLQEKVKGAYKEIVEHRPFKLPMENEIKEAMPLPTNFKRRVMEGVKRDQKYVMVWGRRISKAAIIILVIMFTGLTVYAVIRSKFLYRIFEHNTELSTIEEEMEKGKESIEECYYPTYTGGFALHETVTNDLQVLTTYRNEKEEVIIFMQQAIQTQYSFDNEYTKEECISVNQVEAIMFSKYGETTLIWCEQGYMFELHLPDQYKKIAVEIAESITLE